MENKVKTLKQILTIGSFILLIAGISFQFASSVESYLKPLVMFLISGVFIYLSFYEEKALSYKSGSIISHVLGCVGILVTYLSLGYLELLGSWFSPDGDGELIFIACIFFLAALLLAVSTVRFKVYKLLELSVWISLVGVYMISIYFDADGYLALSVLLAVLFVNNLIRMNGFSKWFTIAISIVSLCFMDSSELLLSTILFSTMIINQLLIIFKEKKTVLVPLLIVLGGLSIYSVELIKAPIVAVGGVAILDFVIQYFKLYDNKLKQVFHKFIINSLYLLLVIVHSEVPFNFIIPCIILISSLVNIYIIKDENEDYLLPIKACYFVIIEMVNITVIDFSTCLILFCANFVNLLLYFFSKKKDVNTIYLVIMILINAAAYFTYEEALVPLIIYLLLFYLDFYIVYMKEHEQQELPLTIIYVIFTFLFVAKSFGSKEFIFLIVSSMVYLIYLLITRKNKFVYSCSLFGFICNALLGLHLIVTNETIYALISELIVIIGIFFLQLIIDDRKNKNIAIGLVAGLQIGVTLFMPLNIVLKIFALVESLVLIALSMIDDDFKALADEGIVGAIFSLLVIIGSIDNLPKSLYLILIGLIIVITIPILIKKYLKKIEENKKLEALKPKEEVKEFPNKTEKYGNNFCGACGTRIDGDYIFCPKCGNKIK